MDNQIFSMNNQITGDEQPKEGELRNNDTKTNKSNKKVVRGCPVTNDLEKDDLGYLLIYAKGAISG